MPIGEAAIPAGGSGPALRQVAALLPATALYLLRFGTGSGVEYLSPALAELLGYPGRAGAEGEPAQDGTALQELALEDLALDDLMAPGEQERLVAAATAGPQPATLELELRTRAGRVVRASHRVQAWSADPRFVLGTFAIHGPAGIEDPFRVVAEYGADAVFLAGPDSRFTWVSESIGALLGWDPADLVGHSVKEFVAPEDLDRLEGELKAVNAGHRVDGRLRLRRADGGQRWVGAVVRPLFGADGEVVGHAGSCRDVQDEVDAQAALAASEQGYRNLVESLPAGILLIDGEGVIVECNEAATRILGLERSRIVGREAARGSWLTVDEHEKEIAPDHKPTRVTAATGAHVDGQVLGIRRPDDSMTWLSVTTRVYHRPEAPDQPWVIAALTDVTTMRTATERLEASEARLRMLAENISDIIVQTDPEARIVWVSPSVTATLGWRPEEILGRPMPSLLRPEQVDQLRSKLQAIMATGAPGGGIELEMATADGNWRWVSIAGRVIRDADGNRIGGVDVIRDVHAEVAARQRLAAAEEQYRMLAENSSDFVFRTSPEGTNQYVSPSVVDVLGLAPEEILGQPWIELIHPLDRPGVAEAQAADSKDAPTVYEARFHGADGGLRWLSVRCRTITGDHDQLLGWVGSARDITEQVEARQALARSEQRFRLALKSAPIGMAVVSLDRAFLEVNNALCGMLGRPERWLLGHRIPDILAPDQDFHDLRMRTDLLAGTAENLSREAVLRTSDGRTLIVEHEVALLRDPDGRPLNYVSQFVDVTAQRQAQAQLAYLATHDQLTQLPNRRELLTSMSRMLAHTPRMGTRLGVLFCDLDGLKAVNDTLGHAAGDELIVATAARIRSCLRASDTVARLGGDEFVVALPAIRTPEDATAIAAKLVSTLAEPYQLTGRSVTSTSSVGVAVGGPGDDPEKLIHQADLALYRAKHEGKNRAVLYDPARDQER